MSLDGAGLLEGAGAITAGLNPPLGEDAAGSAATGGRNTSIGIAAGTLRAGVCEGGWRTASAGATGRGIGKLGTFWRASIGSTISGVTITSSSLLFLSSERDWNSFPKIGRLDKPGILLIV